ncbi:MAG: SusD/RagB family nutrient-binding outer membrane lipoprotein [Prolixibacteraceae bacterium]|nr:SusD/RagB family nutrient-binding outer membrane lipoprotein [Prolixibacteraceae bacterium]NLO01870.1 SusD/RagB family nutrient-binding outer membrane lipoprotein [Bacteroidales bacterium]
MKIFKYILTIFITTSMLFSCDKNFEEINRNVDDPVTVPSSMLIGTMIRNMANELYSTFNGLEHGETWVQHISMVQYNDPERYKPRIGTMDNLWNIFYRTASTANQMYKLAEGEENEINQGVALVIKAYCFAQLTDFFGDVPYTEALLGPSDGLFTPVYDSQETVYNGVLSLLDQAMPLLASGNGDIDPNMDILYEGDASKWARFAASLKFRSLMRISAKRDVSSDLQALVNGGKLFNSESNEAKLVFLSASPDANPMYETIIAGGRGEFKLAKTLVDYMTDISDPRLPVYAQLAVNSGTYVGKPTGYEESPLPGYGYDDVSSIGTKYLEPTAPGYFISYTELLFLMAEAAKKGYISGGDGAAKTYYDEAVRNSFADNGLAARADGYLGLNVVAYNPSIALEQIGRQKWIALFSQGFEAWTEWRRTGLPVLTPAQDGYINQIPSRLRYESNETSINGTNYKAAVAQQGPDELTTKIWWMN